MKLPVLEGRPIRVEVRPSLGNHAAASSIPDRLILLEASVFARRGEFERILVHELFHFVWVRLSNQKRRAWEMVLASELRSRRQGELGWSAECRKEKIKASDVRQRTAAWRRYVCESFCDTAAWLFCGLATHDEFTLALAARKARQVWFAGHVWFAGQAGEAHIKV